MRIAVVRLVTFRGRSAGIVASLGQTITVVALVVVVAFRRRSVDVILCGEAEHSWSQGGRCTRRGAHNSHMREGSTHRALDTRIADNNAASSQRS